jgi:hypothetical protein
MATVEPDQLCVDTIRTLAMDAVLPPSVRARVSVEQPGKVVSAARDQITRRA